VAQWRERDVFGPHASHVEIRVADSSTAPALFAEPVRAVIANYLLGVLPSTVVRHRDGRWEQLYVRTWITGDVDLLRKYTARTFDEIRALADSTEPERVGQLLSLLPLVETEECFLPASPDDVSGFDARSAEGRPGRTAAAFQRYGSTIAVGIDFDALDRHVRSAGFESLKPTGDDRLQTHPRLILRGALHGTREVFDARFAATARDDIAAPIVEARRQADAGWLVEALMSYRAALERSPNDWRVVGEAAKVALQLGDHVTALELARTAVALNPWYTPSLWNGLGDALAGLGRGREAHECYLQGWRIHPGDVETNLRLAGSWLARGDPSRSLGAVARGLAHDSDGMFRHLLLDKQQQAIDYLSLQWTVERQTAARKRR
jgi:Flp pilus assembly protein TadD